MGNTKLFLLKAGRDIRKYKVRSFPIIILLIVGGMTALMFWQMNTAMSETVNQSWKDDFYHDVVITVNPSTMTNLMANVSKVESQIAGPKPIIEYRAFFEARVKGTQNSGYINTRVYAVNTSHPLMVDALNYYEGSTHLDQITTPNVTLIDRVEGNNNHWSSIGDHLNLVTPYGSTINLTTVGAVDSPEYLWLPSGDAAILGVYTGPIIWMNLQDLINLENTSSVINQIAIRFIQPETQKQVFVQKFIETIGTSNILAIEGKDPFVSAMFVFFQSFSIIMALMFGSIAGVMSYIVLGRTIEEQRTNLGLFKALGMKSSEVIESLVVYGILLGIIGGVVGAILGALLGGMATSIMLQAFVRLPINQSTQIDFITVFLYILISVVLCMGSSILATRKITKLTPQAAIRPDISQKVEKNAAIEHFLPIKLSPLRKFSLRTIFRRKRKTTITFFAIFLAVSVIFFSFAFMSLYNGSLNSRFSTYEQWDIQVTFNKEISSANISEDLGLKTFPNTIVEPVILTSIRFSKDITNPIPVIGIKDQSEMRKFDTPNYPQDNAIFVTKDLLYKDNLAINSYINVLLPSNINKSIKVSEALSEGISDTIYTNLDTAREFAGMKLSDGVNSAYIKTTNINDVKGLIQNNLNVDKITLKSDVKDVYYTTYEIYLETFAMIMFAGIIIGIAIIVTIVSISISERKIDFINFRSLGVTNHEIFNIIAVELFMIGLFGIIFGLFGGIALMSIMLEIMVRIGFPIQMSYNILDFLGTIIVAILTIVFSTYLSLRSLFRENIARATLERMLG